jgi:hypothetical protein
MSDSFVQDRYCFAERDSMQIRRETDDALAVIALDQPGIAPAWSVAMFMSSVSC